MRSPLRRARAWPEATASTSPRAATASAPIPILRIISKSGRVFRDVQVRGGRLRGKAPTTATPRLSSLKTTTATAAVEIAMRAAGTFGPSRRRRDQQDERANPEPEAEEMYLANLGEYCGQLVVELRLCRLVDPQQVLELADRDVDRGSGRKAYENGSRSQRHQTRRNGERRGRY